MPEDKRGFMYTVQYNTPNLPEIGWAATTDAEGRCVIPRVPQDATLYLLHDASGLAQLPDRYRSYSKRSPRANNTETTHQLVAGGILRGRIVHPDGSPAAGGSLFLLEKSPYQTAYGTQLQADAEGRFEISQIPPSTYRLRYRAPLGDQDRWVGDEKEDLVVLAGKTTEMGDVALTPAAIVTAKVLDAESGEEIEKPITFRLKAGTHQLRYRFMRSGPETHIPPSSKDAITVEVTDGEHKEIAFRLQRRKSVDVVTGTVLNAKGQPAPQVLVVLLGGNDEESFLVPVETDETGAFRLKLDKPEKNLFVMAWDENSISEPTAVKLGTGVTVKLQDSGLSSIRGQIRDEMGQPIEGAKFSFVHGIDALYDLMSSPVKTNFTVGADGRFEVPRLPRVMREVTLFASKEGYANAALRDQPIEPGKVFEWNPVLKTARETLEGVVVDKAGVPVAGVRVTVSGDAQPSGVKTVTTDAEGRFHAANLSVGEAHVTATQKTAVFTRDAMARINVPKNDVRLVLPEADGRTAGWVSDHLGQPVAGAEIKAISRDRHALSNAKGRFELSGLERGWFSVEVSYRTAAGQDVEHRFRIKTGMKDVRLQMPAKTDDDSPLSAAPLNLIGKPAPDIHVATWINTQPLASKAGGKVRIVDFWGMECGPCLAGFPKVQKFWLEHQQDGIEFIAHGSGFYPEQEVREFLKLHPDYTFPVAIESQPARDGVDYDVRGIPTYVVIGKDGTILSTGHDWAEAEAVALKATGK
jgi:5-hydroxyisourate hydrolase-like protein (transthyretin family)/thiol-disulfide isomerase/thioredoxin